MTLLDAAPHLEADHVPALPPHHHTWNTESSHTTSDGRVHYLRCGVCGVRRVRLDPRAPEASAWTSRDVRPR